MLIDLDIFIFVLIAAAVVTVVGVLSTRWFRNREIERRQRAEGQRVLRRFD